MGSAYRRGVIEMEMAFLDTLSMIALWIGETKESFFQEVILLVPEAEGDVDEPVRVGDSGNSILTPAECSRSSVFMGKVCRR